MLNVAGRTVTTKSCLISALPLALTLIVARPSFTAVTLPFSSTVAISGVTLDHSNSVALPSRLMYEAFNLIEPPTLTYETVS